jgi:uncharacterized protein
MKIFKTILSIIVIILTLISVQGQQSFKHLDIQIQNDTIELFGTLTVPTPLVKKNPITLIIAGSGPTDRDGNNMGMKNNSLKQLAEDLATAGIASIRYDKRGVAASTKQQLKEESMRFDQMVEDAALWIKKIKSDKRFGKVTVIGHSEGVLVGSLIANDAHKFVAIAGASQSADIILKEQIKAQSPTGSALVNPLLDSLKGGMLLRGSYPLLQSLFRPSVQPYLISWFQYEPSKVFSTIKSKCLIIQGDKDLQISVADAERLHAANKKSKLIIIPKMNHVFKRVDSDDRKANIEAYSKPELTNMPELADSIIDFIKKK